MIPSVHTKDRPTVAKSKSETSINSVRSKFGVWVWFNWCSLTGVDSLVHGCGSVVGFVYVYIQRKSIIIR